LNGKLLTSGLKPQSSKALCLGPLSGIAQLTALIGQVSLEIFLRANKHHDVRPVGISLPANNDLENKAAFFLHPHPKQILIGHFLQRNAHSPSKNVETLDRIPVSAYAVREHKSFAAPPGTPDAPPSE